MPETTGPLAGRRAEAARNDGRILDAARAVFLADPEAPVSAVAARAGVGISALYRRYPSKQDLLRALAGDGLSRYITDLEAALASGAEGADPWAAYVECLHRVVEGRSEALAQRLAGTFTPTPELRFTGCRFSRLGYDCFYSSTDVGLWYLDMRVEGGASAGYCRILSSL